MTGLRDVQRAGKTSFLAVSVRVSPGKMFIGGVRRLPSLMQGGHQPIVECLNKTKKGKKKSKLAFFA